MPVTLEEFAVKAHGLGKNAEVQAVLESVEYQLFEIMEEMKRKGVHFAGTRTYEEVSPSPSASVTAYVSLFSGANKETDELRNVAHSLVRMLTAESFFSDEDKKIIGNAAFDDVISSIVENHNLDAALGIHHRIFAAV